MPVGLPTASCSSCPRYICCTSSSLQCPTETTHSWNDWKDHAVLIFVTGKNSQPWTISGVYIVHQFWRWTLLFAHARHIILSTNVWVKYLPTSASKWVNDLLQPPIIFHYILFGSRNLIYTAHLKICVRGKLKWNDSHHHEAGDTFSTVGLRSHRKVNAKQRKCQFTPVHFEFWQLSTRLFNLFRKTLALISQNVFTSFVLTINLNEVFLQKKALQIVFFCRNNIDSLLSKYDNNESPPGEVFGVSNDCLFLCLTRT